MPLEEMNEIVQEYGSAMVNCGPPPGGVADVSKLPYPKSKIKKAVTGVPLLVALGRHLKITDR
jgi:hypothetical protein